MENNKLISEKKTFWKCIVCAAVFEGTLPPEICPVCKAGREAFTICVPENVTFKSEERIKVLMIGSGAASVSAAEAVRKRNPNASIEIYTRENSLPYFRPVLIRALNEKLKDRQYFIHPAPFYKNRNIEIITSKNVRSIDPPNKRITLDDGEKRDFDKLLIATGARAFLPPVQGDELNNVLTLREISDFDKLKQILLHKPKIVIVGGGLLGLETASVLNTMGYDITVVEACHSVLPWRTDSQSSTMLRKIIENSGVKIILGDLVSEIQGNGKVESVKLKSASLIKTDLIIFSTGTIPNSEIANLAEIKCSKGIIVDENMRTSHESIFAAGDCLSRESVGTVGLWDSATEQGRIAGANIAGDKISFKESKTASLLNAFGTKLFSIGDFPEKINDCEIHRFASPENGIIKNIYFKNDRVIGGILLGDTSLVCELIAAVLNEWDSKECEKNKLI